MHSIPTMERLESRCLMSVSPSAPALHILIYGASYINGYQPGNGDVQPLPTILTQLATAAGYKAPVITNLSLDGKTLQYALDHFKSTAVPKDIDYVVFQDQSYLMSNIPNVGNLTQSENAAVKLLNKVKAIAPNAKPMIFEDWGRATSDTAELKKWYPTLSAAAAAKQMAAEIKTNTAAEAAFIDSSIKGTTTLTARVGDAFSNDGLSADLFASDHHHATNEGYMLSGLTFFDTIYGVKSAKFAFASVFSAHSITTSVATKIEKLADAVG